MKRCCRRLFGRLRFCLCRQATTPRVKGRVLSGMSRVRSIRWAPLTVRQWSEAVVRRWTAARSWIDQGMLCSSTADSALWKLSSGCGVGSCRPRYGLTVGRDCLVASSRRCVSTRNNGRRPLRRHPSDSPVSSSAQRRAACGLAGLADLAWCQLR